MSDRGKCPKCHKPGVQICLGCGRPYAEADCKKTGHDKPCNDCPCPGCGEAWHYCKCEPKESSPQPAQPSPCHDNHSLAEMAACAKESQPTSEDCVPIKYKSNVCSKGTTGCCVRHQPTSELPCLACCKFPSQSDEGGSGPKCPECGKFAIVPCKPTGEQSAQVQFTPRMTELLEKVVADREQSVGASDPLAKLSDTEIDTSDIPETKDWSNAERGKFYQGGAEQDAHKAAEEWLQAPEHNLGQATKHRENCGDNLLDPRCELCRDKVLLAAYARHREERLVVWIKKHHDSANENLIMFWRHEFERILKG